MRRISIIIPVYNEEKTIKSIFDQLIQMSSKFKTGSFEIIVINDGSTDKSLDLLKNYPVKIIYHHRQLGYGASLKDGIKNSKFNDIVTIDADGTYPPSELIKLILYGGSFPLVIGNRCNYYSILRHIGDKILAIFASVLFRTWIFDLNSGLRIFNKHIVQRLDYNSWPNKFSFSTTMTLSMIINNLPIKQIPIRCEGRQGPSKANIFSLSMKILKLIFNFLKIKYKK